MDVAGDDDFFSSVPEALTLLKASLCEGVRITTNRSRDPLSHNAAVRWTRSLSYTEDV